MNQRKTQAAIEQLLRGQQLWESQIVGLLYLADIAAIDELGGPVTMARYRRGPTDVELENCLYSGDIEWLCECMAYEGLLVVHEVFDEDGEPWWGPYSWGKCVIVPALRKSEAWILDQVLHTYGDWGARGSLLRAIRESSYYRQTDPGRPIVLASS